ncbi:hypothetical protein QW060_25230 [Myroides ceti]|uniref:Ribosomal protein L23 n=1 Tax=Paenimyroides ceti TaxID=395087 RepID=A0ABT8D009_9FLAO|nr:hypothetical protein [Paenimyroides ceti]MDN3710180.1 hypothetical protein [Paenimyroides ceti]
MKSYTVTGSELQRTLSNNSPLNVTVQTLNASKLILFLKKLKIWAGQKLLLKRFITLRSYKKERFKNRSFFIAVEIFFPDS